MPSKREQDTYHFICRFIDQHHQAPLLTEIASGLNIQSKGTVHRYVQALAKKGLITLIPGRHRGIALPTSHPSSMANNIESDNRMANASLPLLGKIAAGQAIEAIPNEDEINLVDFFIRPNRFALKVQGESMIDAGILDGDMVIIEKRQQADDGSIIVALIDQDDVTLKYIQNNLDGSITLNPANTTLRPHTYPAERIQVQGIVVGQMRSYQ